MEDHNPQLRYDDGRNDHNPELRYDDYNDHSDHNDHNPQPTGPNLVHDTARLVPQPGHRGNDRRPAVRHPLPWLTA